MSAPNITVQDLVLSANETRPVAVTGQYFACPSASTDFNLSIDGGPFQKIKAGTGFPTEQPFTKVLIADISGAGVSLTIFTGAKGVTYQAPVVNTQVTNAPTYTKSAASQPLANGGLLNFIGLDGTKVRKQIIVTNLDATHALLILDKSGTEMGQVFAGQTWTVEVSGLIKVGNSSGASIQLDVGEIYYA